MPQSTTLPFGGPGSTLLRAWALTFYVFIIRPWDLPVLKNQALKKLASQLGYVSLQVWGDRWMLSDEARFVTKWWDVKSHGKLNLLDACLLKPTYSSLCSLIPARDDFDLTGIFFPGASLEVTATAISPSFLSSQPSSPLKIETHGQLAQVFGSSQVFSLIVLLFVYRLLMPELCTSWWGCAPEAFPKV